MRWCRSPTRMDLAYLVVSFLLIFTLQIGFQVANHSYSSEFARTYDEAGHYVTGLMIHDFIAGLDWLTPMAFAENYYIHYPKVALGHWPPGYYLLQAAWTLMFSTSRMSIMVLMALLASLLGLAICLSLKREFGRWAGIGGGLLFVALPLVQANTSVLMLEVFLALSSFLAAISFARYLETEKPLWAAGFTLFAVLAIMTKANGLTLGLVPPLAVLLTRRFRVLRRPSFWIPAALVVALCGPWYWLTLDMLKNGILEQSPTWRYTLAAIPTFSHHLVHSMGLGLFALAGIGFFAKIILPFTRRDVQDRWGALGSLLLAGLIFHWIVPASFEPRHLVSVVPPTVCFVIAGAARLATILPPTDQRVLSKTVLISILAIAISLSEILSTPRRPWFGFGSVAAAVLSLPDLESSVLLISSDPAGEGAFISEVAVREQRPGHFVLRGSKAFSNSRWDGTSYEPYFETTEAMWEFLRGTPIGVVVADRTVPPRYATPDQQLLWDTLAETAADWDLMATFSLIRNGVEHNDAIQVYVQKGHQARQRQSIRVNLTEMLGRHVEFSDTQDR